MRANEVYEGDCLSVMAQFPDNCIDTILTDPPYGLEFMGKDWDYGIPGEVYWREALRVAKPGATLMAFGGTRTHHRLMVAIEDAGWEIRDVIMWVYGSGFPKSLDVSKVIDKAKGEERERIGIRHDAAKLNNPGNAQYHVGWQRPWRDDPDKWEEKKYITSPSSPLAKTFNGYGTALKPAYEPIIIAMKPVDHSFANNAEKWGVSGLWIDGARIGIEERTSALKDFSPVHGNKLGNGSYIPTIGYKQVIGRFPANLIHDGSDEVMAEFDKAGERTSGKPGKSKRSGKNNGYDGGWGDSPLTGIGDSGSAARFFYCAKACPAERSTPGNNHPTVKPLSLIRYLAKLTKTPTGGIVLDPFAGSGTTALAAIAEGRDYILIEKEPEYVKLCRRRIAEYTGQEIAPVEVELTDDQKVKQLALW